jgi:hypothetical protein
MAAGKYDFSIEQGSSYSVTFTYNDADNNPVDLTNWCARISWLTNDGNTQVFTSENTDPSLYNLTCGPSGEVVFQIPATVTNGYTFNSAKYDLELESPTDLYTGGGNIVVRVLYGKITLVKRYSLYTSNLECL